MLIDSTTPTKQEYITKGTDDMTNINATDVFKNAICLSYIHQYSQSVKSYLKFIADEYLTDDKNIENLVADTRIAKVDNRYFVAWSLNAGGNREIDIDDMETEERYLKASNTYGSGRYLIEFTDSNMPIKTYYNISHSVLSTVNKETTFALSSLPFVEKDNIEFQCYTERLAQYICTTRNLTSKMQIEEF